MKEQEKDLGGHESHGGRDGLTHGAAITASHVAEIAGYVTTLKALLGPEHETDEEAPAIPYCNWCHQSKPWHAVGCHWVAGTTALAALRNELDRLLGSGNQPSHDHSASTRRSEAS